MKVAILGTGVVGQTLAKGFAGLGYEVVIGTRDPAAPKAKEAAAAAGAPVASFADASRDCDLAVIATLWAGTEAALALAGSDNLASKLVIDVTNPLDFSTGTPKLAVGHATSGAEMVQAWLPKSHVVKALNIVTAGHMVNPNLPGGPPTMFIAGNDAQAKGKVLALLASFGWESIDIGGLEGARLLEPLALLWITYGFQNNHWTHAFKLLNPKS